MNTNEKIAQAKKLREFIEKNADLLTDDAALDLPNAFPRWTTGKAYIVGERVRYEEKLYKCVQAHTSQADWTPPATPALWTEVSPEGVIPDWKQPTGAQDAYAKGDKVKHNGSTWISTVDSNVWEPGIYGWDVC